MEIGVPVSYNGIRTCVEARVLVPLVNCKTDVAADGRTPRRNRSGLRSGQRNAARRRWPVLRALLYFNDVIIIILKNIIIIYNSAVCSA